jgi:hypothetical protein
MASSWRQNDICVGRAVFARGRRKGFSGICRPRGRQRFAIRLPWQRRKTVGPLGEQPRDRIRTASLFIDGRQLPVAVDGKQPQSNAAVVTAGTKTSKYAFRVDHNLISPGAHVAALLLTETWRAEWKGLHARADVPFWWTFTVLKNATALAPREPLAAATKEPLDRKNPRRVRSCSPCQVSAAGALTLRLGIAPHKPTCPGLSFGYTVVALLDGVEIPFGEHGFAPHFDVTADEIALVDVHFENLPIDTKFHELYLYQVVDRRYMEGPRGYRSPWRDDTVNSLVRTAWMSPYGPSP